MNINEEVGANPVPQTTGAPNSPALLGYGQQTVPQRTAIPVPFTNVDTLFTALVFVCGYLFVWLVNPFFLGFGVTAFTLCFCCVTLFYFKRRGIPIPMQSHIWLTVILTSSANFSLFSNVSLQFINLLFLMGCTVYWISVLASTRMEKSFGSYFLSDMVNQLFNVPFGNFNCASRIIKDSSAKNKKSKVLLASLCGVLAIIPLVLIVTSLLIQADDEFKTVINQITASIGEQFIRFLLRLIPAFLVGSYLFGLLYGNIEKRRVDTITAEKAVRFSRNCKRLPVAASITALCILCGVYLLFIGTQAVSLFSAFYNQRPEGLTYAEYARHGFFELCQVVAINLGVMAVTSVFTVQKEKKSKFLSFIQIVLCVETMLLIITAIRKMVMYIDRYGLTQKRVYTSYFMILLFVIFCVLIVAQLRKINLTKSIVLTFVIGFLVLCYANVDGIIVKYNIDRYQNGTLQNIDLSTVYSSLDASKPYVFELYQSTSDQKLKGELKNILQSKTSVPYQGMNLQKLWARTLNAE